MELSDRVRTLRKQYGYTLRELSSLTDLSIPYLSDIEHGRANPSFNSLQSIARALNIRLSELFQDVYSEGAEEHEQLPAGLVELINDEEFRNELTEEWISLLRNMRLGEKYPQSKREWMEIYFVLKRILED